MLRSPLVVLAMLALTTAAATAVGGDEDVVDDRFTIVAGYASEANPDHVQEERERQGTLTATVDGEECVTVDITEMGDVPIVLGSASQPEACGRGGAEVILYNQHGNEMHERFVIEPGGSATLENYAVAPLDTSEPAPAEVGSAGIGAQSDAAG